MIDLAILLERRKFRVFVKVYSRLQSPPLPEEWVPVVVNLSGTPQAIGPRLKVDG